MSGRVNVNAAEKDVEKYIKFLALKSTQVVVQARLGEKMQTACNPIASGSDWFNIVIHDHPDIYMETKRALALEPGQSILKRLPLCIEISLRTVEGDQMVLEVWSLDIQLPGCHKNCKDDICEVFINNAENGGGGKGGVTNGAPMTEQQTLKAAHTIYNRMGILLKSLISLTRATPAYKLSRRQCPEAYGIYYRIYVERPQLHTLGEGYKNVKIGHLNTICGTVSMSVHYRTKMTITPTTADGETNAIMLKSDHFRKGGDTSPTLNISMNDLKKGSGGTNGTRKIVDIEKPLRPGAFTDVGKLRQWTEKDYILPETPPFEWLLRRPRHESGGSAGSIESLNKKSDSSGAAVTLPTICSNGGVQEHQANNNVANGGNSVGANTSSNTKATLNNNNVMAFKSLENGVGVQNGMQTAKSPNDGATTTTTTAAVTTTQTFSQSPPIKSLLIPAPTTTHQNTTPQLQHQMSHNRRPDDDNLLKELNFPFALPNSHVNDLAKFYRDCYHAPPLLGLNETQPEIAVEQLDEFETSLEDYDELVSQLGLSTSSSTGSRSSGGLQMSN